MSDRVRDKFVSNIGPQDAKLVCIGEAPGETEETGTSENGYHPEPFLGWAGEKLIECLHKNGAPRNTVFLGNLCNYRPAYGNRFRLLLNTPQLQQSFKSLYDHLLKNKPNVIIALGAWPLLFLTGKRGKNDGSGIGLWRGSILPCSLPGLENVKVIPTYHPSAVNRDRTLYPIFNDDIKKAITDSAFPEFNYRHRKFITSPSDDELEFYTQEFLRADKLAIDVENFKGAKLSCVGFAPSPDLAMCIPTLNPSHHALDCIQRLVKSSIPKILQFGTHDAEVLHLNLNLDIVNYYWDTMSAQVVMWPGMPASLAYLTSVYTREPYYKEERKSEEGKEIKTWNAKFNKDKLWKYNCLMKGNRIKFADGTTEYIDVIVKKKISKPVLSYNIITNKVEPKNITDWHRARIQNQQWVQINIKHQIGSRGLVVTPDHKIYTERGLIEAKDVTINDKILTDEPLLSKEEYQILIGTILGDGYLESKNNNLAGLVTVSTNHDYINWKAKILKGRIIIRKHLTNYSNPNTGTISELGLKYTRQQRNLRQDFYNERVKEPNLNIIKTLDGLGFATWYMDDGCLVADKSARIATCGFSHDSVIILTHYLSSLFGLVTVIQQDNIAFCVKASSKFFDFIADYVPQCMQYKLPKEFQGRYKEIIKTEVSGVYAEKIISVKNYEHLGLARGYNNVRYCITVEDNHNFFTTHGLVKNCKDCCVTYEIQEAQEKEMLEGPPGWMKTFKFQMKMIPVAGRISRAGMLVDQERKKTIGEQFLQDWFSMQQDLERLIGNTNELHLIRKNGKDIIKNCKANVNSKKQITVLLYDILGLKEHYARKENEEGNRSRTVDKDALIAMLAETKERLDSVKKQSTKNEWAKKHLIVKLVHQIRALRKRKGSYTDYKTSSDDRARGTYKSQGAKFGRWGVEKYVDGTGLGIQTFPRD